MMDIKHDSDARENVHFKGKYVSYSGTWSCDLYRRVVLYKIVI